MKSSIAPSWAAASLPVEITLNSLMSLATSGRAAKALAVWIIWMRQMLPTKPLTRAMRNGPWWASHFMYLVSLSQGAKHWGMAPGPATIFGAADAGTDSTGTDSKAAAAIAATWRNSIRSSLKMGFALRTIETRPT